MSAIIILGVPIWDLDMHMFNHQKSRNVEIPNEIPTLLIISRFFIEIVERPIAAHGAPNYPPEGGLLKQVLLEGE